LDITAAAKYAHGIVSDDNFSQHNKHDMVLSLLPWSEMDKYDSNSYPTNVQRSGKIFIHFPIYEKSLCEHIYVAKTSCNEIPCGIFAPFLDMRAIISMIDSYMKTGKRVLVYAHKDMNRMLLFVACCMIQDGFQFEDIMSDIEILDIGSEYLSYVEAYAKYLREIN
jgi:hypothetical protein